MRWFILVVLLVFPNAQAFGPPAARVGDMHSGPCTLGSPLPILAPGAPTVLIEGMPAARAADMAVGLVAPPSANFPPHPIARGSATVLIGNLPAARIGDLCSIGGAIVAGAPTVLIGG